MFLVTVNMIKQTGAVREQSRGNKISRISVFTVIIAEISSSLSFGLLRE